MPLLTLALNWALNIMILLVCSIILAIPIVIITMDWSKTASWNLYGIATRLVHAHSPAIVSLDNNGVPVVDYGYQAGKNIGKQRNPLTIAHKALAYFEEFSKRRRVSDKEFFFNCIHWLEESEIDNDSYSLWAYEFDATAYNASPPFFSALAQTAIMVAFERAFEITLDEHYRQIADKAMLALKVPIEQGGVLVTDPRDGGKWYEEYAFGAGRLPTPFVLNGFISTILYLNDYYIRTGSKQAKSLFDDVVIELKRHLADYDTGYWTYYDREGHLAYDYHYIHIDQMQKLYEITGDTVFKAYHDKWASYFPINPMWARGRFAAYLLDAAIIFTSFTFIMVIYKIFKIP
jgi:hypothetical protein